VSTLDFANGVTLSGFRVPALSTRRAETELELMNGQTFAMAGLLDNTVTNTLQKIPGIGDIPILGELFKSRSAQKDKTELVVMITPEILPRNSPGVTTELPRTQEQYLPAIPDKKSHPQPPPAFEPKPSDADMKAAGSVTAPAKKGEPVKKNEDPAAAAARVSALTPASRPVNNADGAAPSTTAPAAASRPLTPQEQQALERVHKQELVQKKADDERMAALEKRAAKERAEQAKKDKIEQERQAKLAKEQAERDREEAKKKAEADAKQAKVIAEAAAKLKAAQDAYQAEIAKKQQQQPKDK
jgi:hypothetical protein